MPNSIGVHRLDFRCPHHSGGASALGPASGVCLALGPVFPEVVHRGPSLNWSGGHIPIRGAPYVLSFCVCVCVCVCVCARLWGTLKVLI